jgi:hypothetical protein
MSTWLTMVIGSRLSSASNPETRKTELKMASATANDLKTSFMNDSLNVWGQLALIGALVAGPSSVTWLP